MPMKAARSAVWRSCCQVSTARWRNSKAGSASAGATPSVVVATEFGRTARINGTEGTDHGTGTIALARRRRGERRTGDFGLAGAEARQSL